ncbi:MAG: serine/threonine-protein kinase [Blastocatellia bacterium]|nr:serine/threonine-protein kinase [Blastocatellia bacterium]
MNSERWRKIEELYFEAQQREVSARPAYLVEACAGDEELRQEVMALLSADGQADDFLDRSQLEASLAPQSAKTLPLPPRRIGRYRVVSRLGAGGMGEVFLGEDTTLKRRVALKLLSAQFTTHPEYIRRFEREARAISALNHPNILTIHEIGRENDLHYLVTEFVEGETLRAVLNRGRLPLGTAHEIAMQIATALAAAHRAGVVHRDIKPENVMVRRDGIVKVLDFGLAKLTPAPGEWTTQSGDSGGSHDQPTQAEAAQAMTVQGMIMGTPRYMSPEQARGETLDARTDVFSFGVMLYEMFANAIPFTGGNAIEIMAAILEREPQPMAIHDPTVPVALQEIVARALNKDRARRYQSFDELLPELKSFRRDLEADAARHAAATVRIPAAPSEIITNGVPWERPRARRFRAVAIGAALVLLLAAAGWFLWTRRQPPPPMTTSEFSELFLSLGRWTTPPAGWAIREGRLHIEAQPQLGFPHAIRYGDFTMTFHLKLDNAGGAAWALRVRDRDNYYLFQLAGPESDRSGQGYFHTWIVRDGQFGAPEKSIPVTTRLTAGGEYTINIDARGNEITHRINSADEPSAEPLGDPLGYFKDDFNVFPAGAVGFRTVGAERFSIAELYVQPLDQRLEMKPSP